MLKHSNHRIVVPFVNKLPATTKRVSEIISPEIDRRRKLMDEYGKDYPDKTVNPDFHEHLAKAHAVF
jgi:hypothetical protein